MRTRIAVGLLITLTSMTFTLGATSGSAKLGVGRTLSKQEASRIYGGVLGKKCGDDPRCTQPCNFNNEVAFCFASTTDYGTCFNQTQSYQRQALNQRRCVVDAPGWACTESQNYVDDSCRVYVACEWDSVAPQCSSVLPSIPCFSFPMGCSAGQAPP